MSKTHGDQSDTRIVRFNTLYDNLASAWESHQQLRSTHPHIAELALSSTHLDAARAEMWSWWKQNRLEAR